MKFPCPQCGADIVLQPRSLQLVCPFCHTSLKLSKEPALERYRIEPTIEEKPALAIAHDLLLKQGKAEEISEQTMEYLPFYRFLCEKNGTFIEHVCSALGDSPFPLFSIPSGTLAPIEENGPLGGTTPAKELFEILKHEKLRKVMSIEEMLLLFVPFWKITLSNGEVIWIDAVEGRAAPLPMRRRARHTPGIFRKLVLSGALIALFIIGIQIVPFPMSMLFQLGGAGLLFFLLRKEMRDAA